MNIKETKKISKFLSLVLRHRPEKINHTLDKNGWANVSELLEKMKIPMTTLEVVVAENDKKRFSFNEDKTKIRANQGHSLTQVDLELKSVQPPDFLFHGTVAKFMESIQKNGLLKMSRQHVHLSKDRDTAVKVGSRRGKPIILSVRSGEMFQDGFEFFCSDNGVWLADQVPVKYINFK